MWRWLSGLPRAIRQQVHGPRTATGVCVEEEAELEHKYKEARRKRSSFDQNNVGQFNTCSSGYHNHEGSKHGPDQEKFSQKCTKDCFPFFHGTHALEALGWGAAVVLGIHLSKYPKKCSYEERYKRRTSVEVQNKCLLYHIALAIPDKVRGRSLARSIVGNNIGVTRTTREDSDAYDSEKQEDVKYFKGHDADDGSRSFDGQRQAEIIRALPREECQSQNVDSLHKVMNEFEGMCRKYTGIGKNIQGLQASAKNHLKKAVNNFIDASHLGYTKAQFNIGLCFENGKGVKVDLRKAEKYYKLAADDGHPQAMYNLALMYLKGEGGIKKDIVAALELLHKAAEIGLGQAMYNLALMYLKGKGGIKKDIVAALELLHKAAEIGLGQAQTYLGVYYTEEESQDLERAVSFFKSAAEQNDPEAQYFLGICYENGWGVEVNECKSAELYSQAASSGHDGALYNLGVYHELAMGGIPEDKVSAIELYQMAAAAGNEQAIFQLTGLKADTLREDLDFPPIDDQRNQLHRHESEDEIPNQLVDRQCLKLNVSHSSPSLTEYVRHHFHSFISSNTTVPYSTQDPLTLLKNHQENLNPDTGIMYNGKITQDTELPPILPQLADWKPQYGSPRRSPESSEKVSFTIGDDDEDLESLLSFEGGFDSSLKDFPQNTQFCSSMSRNSTMPNLHCVSCS